MTVKLSSVVVDLAKEREGDWVPSLELPGVEFKVRSIEFPAFKYARDAQLQRLFIRHGKDPFPLDEREEFDQFVRFLAAKELLLDWKGFDEPYGAAQAEAMRSDPSYRRIADAVLSCAARVSALEIKYVEDAAKN